MLPVEWRDGAVRFLDQTRLPAEERYVETTEPAVLAEALKTLAIRGAPLIGIAAAYGVALSIQALSEKDSPKLQSHLEKSINLFASTRPTAVNLFWALERIRRTFLDNRGEPLPRLKDMILKEALAIHEEDRQMCEEIGRTGAEILPPAASVLTHCNTGRLATGGKGTALAVIQTAWERHRLRHVYIGETRPLLQGARLTAWELKTLGIPATLIADAAAPFLFQQGKVNAVVVGADRIAANGDVANKVGTYALAIAARHHHVPFYVAAPTSSIDWETGRGKEIPIEQRDEREITETFGHKVAPDGIEVYNPAFDITPAELVTAMITERGVAKPPFESSLRSLMPAKRFVEGAGT